VDARTLRGGRDGRGDRGGVAVDGAERGTAGGREDAAWSRGRRRGPGRRRSRWRGVGDGGCEDAARRTGLGGGGRRAAAARAHPPPHQEGRREREREEGEGEMEVRGQILVKFDGFFGKKYERRPGLRVDSTKARGFFCKKTAARPI